MNWSRSKIICTKICNILPTKYAPTEHKFPTTICFLCLRFAVALDLFLSDPWIHHKQEQDATLDMDAPVEKDALS